MTELGTSEELDNILDELLHQKVKTEKYKIKISYVDLAFEVLQADQYHRDDMFISGKEFNDIYDRFHEFETLVPRGMSSRVKRDKPNTLLTFLNHILEYSSVVIVPCYTNPSDRKPSFYHIRFDTIIG